MYVIHKNFCELKLLAFSCSGWNQWDEAFCLDTIIFFFFKQKNLYPPMTACMWLPFAHQLGECYHREVRLYGGERGGGMGGWTQEAHVRPDFWLTHLYKQSHEICLVFQSSVQSSFASTGFNLFQGTQWFSWTVTTLGGDIGPDVRERVAGKSLNKMNPCRVTWPEGGVRVSLEQNELGQRRTWGV